MADFRINVIVDPSGAVRGTRVVRRQLQRTEQQGDRLQQALTRALSFAAVAQTTRVVVGLTDTFTNLQNRLRTVTDGQAQLAAVTNELFEISQRTRGSFEATAELYARVGLASRELGLTTQDTLEFTESLNQAVILSGASAQEATAGLIQLSQGLASGTLRGDELRSVLEQLPVVSDVIAESLGITRGQLRELGEQGRITAAQVITAFREAREELAERFAETVPTISQGFLLLRNSAILLAGQFDAATGSSRRFANALVFLSENLEVVARATGVLATAIGTTLALRAIPSAIAAVQSFTAAIAANPIGAFAVIVTTAASALVFFGDQIPGVAQALQAISVFAEGAFAAIPIAIDNITQLINQQFLPAFVDAFAAIRQALIDFGGLLVDSLAFDSVVAGLQRLEAAGQALIDAFQESLLLDSVVAGFEALQVAAIELFDILDNTVIVQSLLAGFAALPGIVSGFLGSLRRALDTLLADLSQRYRFFVSSLSTVFGRIFDDIELSFVGLLRVGARTIDVLVGLFLGAARAIPTAFDNFPATLEAVFVEAANAALAPIAGLVNFTVDSLNEIFRRTGLEEIELPRIPVLEASQEAQEAGRRIVEALRSGLEDSTAAEDTLDEVIAQLNEIQQLTQEQAAGTPATRRAGGASEFDQLLQQLQNENDLLEINDELRRRQSAAVLDFIDQLGPLTDAQERLVEAEVARNFALEEENDVLQRIRGPLQDITRQRQALTAVFENGKISIDEYREALEDLDAAARRFDNTLGAAFGRVVDEARERLDGFADDLASTLIGAFESTANALADFLTTFQQATVEVVRIGDEDRISGAVSNLQRLEETFANLATSILNDLARLAANQLLFSLLGALGGSALPGGAAGAGALSNLFAGLATPGGGPPPALPRMQMGGSFLVGGSGGIDSQLVAFRATPGERVDVFTPSQQRQAQAPAPAPEVRLQINNITDPRDVLQVLQSPEGQRVINNVIQRNGSAVRRFTRS